MYHCKVIIADDLWVSIGSTNYDDRSFRWNDDANLNVFDAEFAARQVIAFDADKANSRRMKRTEFKDRPTAGKRWDRIAVALRRHL